MLQLLIDIQLRHHWKETLIIPSLVKSLVQRLTVSYLVTLLFVLSCTITPLLCSNHKYYTPEHLTHSL